MLTEDFLTVLSAVDEDLMIKLVRAQTRDGGTVIDFLDDVMHNTDDGFRPNHRIAAARELISHILRDEHGPPHPPRRRRACPVLDTGGGPTCPPAFRPPDPVYRRAGFETRPPRRGAETRQPPIHRSRE